MPKRPPSSKSVKSSTSREGGEERLQKVLASAGLGSRRQCEELITEGRVEIDKEVVTQLGTKVDPERQKIRVDGVPLKIPGRVYYAVNKPAGSLSTNQDPDGRLRVIDLVGTDQHVFTVGRLDKSSEGLIIVTNDGDLANRLTHPRYGVEKTYIVHVVGNPTRESLEQLERGVYLAEGLARVAGLKTKRRFKHYTELEIILNEGRNREIRRLLARIGNKVVRLRRVAIGPLKLGDQPVGTHRKLTDKEVAQLRSAATGSKKPKSRRKTAKSAKSRPRATTSDERRAPEKRPKKHTKAPVKKRTGSKPSTSKQSTSKQSTSKQSTSKQSTSKQSTSKQSTSKRTTKRPATKRPATKRPATKRPPTKRPPTKRKGRR